MPRIFGFEQPDSKERSEKQFVSESDSSCGIIETSGCFDQKRPGGRSRQVGLHPQERRNARKYLKVDYDIRDFTLDYIVQQFQEGLFFIPDYQREFIWREKNQCEFIESLILGLPIPFMFGADTEEGNLEIVDGAQRIQTLESFFNDDLRNHFNRPSYLRGCL